MKILVIDDEVTRSEPVGKKIVKLLEPEGFKVLFCKTWMDEGYGEKSIDVIKKDREVGLVLLDVEFPGQRLEGGAIFEEIKKIMPELSVVILTKRDVHTEAEDFEERGAVRYIVKEEFNKRSQWLLNYIKGSIYDPSNSQYVLHIRQVSEKIYYIDIQDKVGRSMLKQRRVLSSPIKEILLGCIKAPDKTVSFPGPGKNGAIIGSFTRSDIHKEVWKFKDGIKKSSQGRVQSIIKGCATYGATEFELVIGEVKIESKKCR